MAGLDALARMKAQLLAERRDQMRQAPQQMGALVNQGSDALARFSQYLAQQDAERDRASALAAQKELDRKNRMAIEQARAKQRAEALRTKLEAEAPVRQSTVDRNLASRDRTRQQMDLDPTALSVLGKRVDDEISAPVEDDGMPAGDFDLAGPDERLSMPGAYDPRERYALERRRQSAESRGLDSDLMRERIRREGALADKANKTGAWLERKDRPAAPNVPEKAYGEDAAPPGQAAPSLGGLRGTVPRTKLPKGQKVFEKELNKYSPEATADMMRKYDEAIALIESGRVDTGPFATPWEEFKDKRFGVGDPETMKVIGLIEELRDAPSRDKSGAVIGIQEQESLGGIFGRKNIDEDTLVGLLRQARHWLLQKDYGLRKTAASAGIVLNDAPYDPREVEASPAPQGGSAPPASTIGGRPVSEMSDEELERIVNGG